MTSISLDLPDDIVEGLSTLRKLTGQNEQHHVTAALREYLIDITDLYLAERIAKDIDEGRTETVPLEEVMKEYGLDGQH